MPIDLTKHAKIWIHPEGIIPNKIIDRLILQREVRPNDTLSLFVNRTCMATSANKIVQLRECNIDIIIIEDELASSYQDDPLLIHWVNTILQRGAITKEIIDSVYASDLLRMMHVVQKKGLYSDTDVFFLPNDHTIILDTSYLFGTHHEGGMGADINVFGVDSYLMPTFYQILVNALKELKNERLGADIDIDVNNVDRVMLLPSILYIPNNAFQNEHEHTLRNYIQTQSDVIYHIEDHSWCEPQLEALLHNDSIPDKLLMEVKERLFPSNNTIKSMIF